MHILFLTDNFPPEFNAPASRTYAHCREWARAGHKVTVITCVPNFPKGRVFPGYRNKLWQTEQVEGVRVVRVWSYVTANEGFLKRILDYQSFMVTAVIASIFVVKADLVVGTSPQFFTVCAAYVVSRLKRIPFVFELRDLWPESIKAVGAIKNRFVLARLESLELFLYKKARKIIAVTSSFKKNLMDRGVDGGKIAVIRNGVDTSLFKPGEKDAELAGQLGLAGKFVAGYLGTHGLAHALETLLDAAEMLQNDENGRDVRIVFLGGGARKKALVAAALKRGLKNVLFIDSVPKTQVTRYWSLLDVAITHLRKAEIFTTVIPSKLFDGIGMGIPVLHGVEGESSDIVEREGVGVCFEPENAEALYKGLLRLRGDDALREQIKKNCLAAAQKYDRVKLAAQMLEELKNLVPIPARDTAIEIKGCGK